MKTDSADERERTITSIQEAVASVLGLTVEELRQATNRHVVAVPRQIAMYLVKQMTDASLPEIGRHFGGKHHTTVMHSIAKIHKARSSETEVNHAVTKLLADLTRSR
jgi:chromosomal replication initiator protein